MQQFRDSLIIRAPVGRVFHYYTDLRNLARMTPVELHMRVVRAELPLRQGSHVRFALRPRGVPFEIRWDSIIDEYAINSVFSDRQTKGPFEHWVHRHKFRSLEDGRTEVTDVIEVGAPLGVFGKLAERIFIGHKIQAMFDYRRKIVRRDLERHPEKPAPPA
ncbi:SRPBCC family protein [Candidatus Poribacteria bacterium]|nr:SRPBCC family protein [Candidatus Poribacteria bacterium]